MINFLMEEDIKRWTTMSKTAVVLDIIGAKTTILEAYRALDLNLRSNCKTCRRPLTKPRRNYVPKN